MRRFWSRIDQTETLAAVIFLKKPYRVKKCLFSIIYVNSSAAIRSFMPTSDGMLIDMEIRQGRGPGFGKDDSSMRRGFRPGADEKMRGKHHRRKWRNQPILAHHFNGRFLRENSPPTVCLNSRAVRRIREDKADPALCGQGRRCYDRYHLSLGKQSLPFHEDGQRPAPCGGFWRSL